MNEKIRIVVAMVIFGTLGIFIKNIPLPSSEIALYRGIIAIITIVIVQLVKGNMLVMVKIKKELLLLFLSGAAMGFNWILLFEAYRYTSVSIATLSYYFAPVIVMIVCPIIFKESLTKKQIFCFLMSTCGLVLIIGVERVNINLQNLKGIAFGLGAAVLYASVIILNKGIKKVDGMNRTILQLIAAIIVLGVYISSSQGFHLKRVGKIGMVSLIIVGVLHTGIAYYMYFSSLKELKGQEVAILSYMDPLVAVIISVIILNETIGGLQLIGGGMILGFTLLNELDKSKKIYRANKEKR